MALLCFAAEDMAASDPGPYRDGTQHETARQAGGHCFLLTLCIPIASAWKGMLDIQTRGAETSLFAKQNFDVLYEKVSANSDVSAPLIWT